MQRFLLIISLLIIIAPCLGARQQIVTISAGLNGEKVTTGNGNTKRINYEKLHAKNPAKRRFSVDKKILETVQKLAGIKDQMIVDFANEDPKIFKLSEPNYWLTASKRGYMFNLLAIVVLIIFFWIFSIRIGRGDCGGYKAIIRKPSKSDRVKIYIRTFIGAGIFFAAFLTANVLLYQDRQMAKASGEKLVQNNKKQYTRAENAIKKIEAINNQHIDIIYSSLSYERLRVGMFIKPLLKSFKRSIRQAEEFNRGFFLGTSNHLYIRILIIILTVSLALTSFTYAYKHRVLTKSLMICAGVGVVAVFTLNTMNTQFNYWSVFVELCSETTKAVTTQPGGFSPESRNALALIINCLSQKEDYMLREQMISLMIAQNTLLTILRNYFEVQDLAVKMNNFLVSADSIVDNFEELMTKVAEASKKSSVKREHIEQIVKTSRDISGIYNDLEPLLSSDDVKEWSVFHNDSVCKTGINFQFYTLFALFGMFIGIIMLGTAMFSAENVVRGLYNEEIQYVKTNKLRYDWN